MKPISAKIIISLSLLLSIIAQPLLAVAMPCSMQGSDMAAMNMVDAHPAGHQMAADAQASMSTIADMPMVDLNMDCCGDDNGCAMSSCVVAALQLESNLSLTAQPVGAASFYSPLYRSTEAQSLYRPPISR